MIEFVTVAKVGSIEAGHGVAFEVRGRMIAVFNDDGAYHAINDFCPHMGASLAEGYFENGVVTCPWHAWRFRVCDGTWCDNPVVKTDAYQVRVVGENIQVGLPPADTAPPADADTDSKDTESKDTRDTAAKDTEAADTEAPPADALDSERPAADSDHGK